MPDQDLPKINGTCPRCGQGGSLEYRDGAIHVKCDCDPLSPSSSLGGPRQELNAVVCGKCGRELMPEVLPHRLAYQQPDSVTIGWLLLVLRQFTYTPMQAEHLMVVLRGQTR